MLTRDLDSVKKKERKLDASRDEGQMGFAARESGDHETALSCFEAAARRKPDHVATQMEIATTLAHLGRLDEAEACCRRVLERKPKNTKALIVVGRIKRQLSQYAEALANFEAAIAIEPDHMGAQMESARTLVKLDRLAEAEQRCRDALRRQPDYPQATTLLGDIARLQGATAAVPAPAAPVVEKLAKTPEDRLEAVRALRREEHFGDAEALCRRSLKRYPDEVRIQHELALNLRHQHRFEAALDVILPAAAANPGDMQIQLETGLLLRSLDRLDESKTVYQGILRQRRTNVAAMRGLAFIARQRSELPEALALYKDVAAAQPEDPVIHLETATLLGEMLRFDEAEAALKRFEELAGAKDSSDHLGRKFQYFCVTTQWERAAECLKCWPSHKDVPREAVANVAKYYAEQGLWNDLVDFFHERVIEGRWTWLAQATEAVLEAISAAARQTQRYDEVLADLPRWPNKATQAEVDNLRDQIIEEMSLLRAIGLMAAGADGPGAPVISNPLRAHRHAMLMEALREKVIAPKKSGRAKAAAQSKLPDVLAGTDNTVYYCTDAKYLGGATVSLFSLLRHNPACLPYCTFIVYCPPELIDFASNIFGDIATFTGARIEVRSTAGFFSEEVVFRTKWGAFTAGRGLSQAAYYRIFAAVQLMNEKRAGRALYVDADTCVGPRLAELLSFDMQGHPLGVRLERDSNRGVQRAIVKLGMQPGTYFNSGVLLVDLAHPDLEPALERTIDVAVNKQHLLSMVDQCALNLGFMDITAKLPKECNFFIDDGEVVAPLPRQPIVTHFTAHPKPWDPWYRSEHCTHWISEFAALREAVPLTTLQRLMGNFFPRARSVVSANGSE